MKDLVYILAILFCFISLSEATAPPLETYDVEKDKISVSGFSSGGFFSTQLHVAHSATIMGAGIIAGGPYYCAEGELSPYSLLKCAQIGSLLQVGVLVNEVIRAAEEGQIDDPSNLVDSKVFVFCGSLDPVVKPSVVRKTAEFYERFDVDLETEFGIHAGHGFVTDDYGVLCPLTFPPAINNCGYSTPYHILSHIYGDITYANSEAAITENLLTFDQTEFFSIYRTSLDHTGFVYVPDACRTNSARCRLHVAFHGCTQGRVTLGSIYALHTEYNGLAEVNNIIILYPQATISVVNPFVCWDFVGYTSEHYVHKDGLQITAVMNMIERVAGLDPQI